MWPFKNNRPAASEEDACRLLSVLEDIGNRLNPRAFDIIKKDIQDYIIEHADHIGPTLEKGRTPEQIIYGLIRDFAGGRLETGWYHIYRGYLNPLGEGLELRMIFYISLKELLKSGAITEQDAADASLALSKAIKEKG